MIPWDEKYETGFIEIDQQHQWLFEFVNSLEQQLLSHDETPDLSIFLTSLEEYARRHFNYEENCMVKCHCPAADQNRTAHKRFIEVYENFLERFEREGHSEKLAWKIHKMFQRWITEHICKIDIQLRGCQQTDT